MSHFVRPLSVLLSLAFGTFLALAPAIPRAAEDIGAETGKSLPIEAALIYNKLLKRQPNYTTIIWHNPIAQKNTRRFGHKAMIEQQRRDLQELYDQIDENTVLYTRAMFHFDSVNVEKRTVTFVNMPPDLHFEYQLFPDE